MTLFLCVSSNDFYVILTSEYTNRYDVFLMKDLNKRRLSCAKLTPQSTSFMGPIELFFGWFELLHCSIVELLNGLIVEVWKCGSVERFKC